MRLKSGLAIIMLLSFSAVPLRAWKVVPEEKDRGSDIKTIIIVDDRLIIVNSQNTIDVKFSDLEKLSRGIKMSADPAPSPAAPPVKTTAEPGKVTGDLRVMEKSPPTVVPPTAASSDVTAEALATEEIIRKKIAESGIWYVFVAHPQRFKIFGQKQYMPMKEGMVLKGATVNKRLYLENLDHVLFEPTWENSYDFNRYVAEFVKYLESLKKRLTDLDNNIASVKAEREENMRNIYFLVDQIVQLLKDRNYTRAKIVSKDGDVNLNVIKQEDVEPNAMTVYLDLQRKLSREERNKREADRRIRSLVREKNDLLAFYEQMEASWKAIPSKPPEPQKAQP